MPKGFYGEKAEREAGGAGRRLGGTRRGRGRGTGGGVERMKVGKEGGERER